MKISEIILNHDDLLIETLQNNIASVVATQYKILKIDSNNFLLAPQDAFSMDEISDHLYYLKKLLNRSSEYFNETSQTLRLLNSLINYLNTGI